MNTTHAADELPDDVGTDFAATTPAPAFGSATGTLASVSDGPQTAKTEAMPERERPADGDTAGRSRRADAICEEFGLSQRERDVCLLLAKGYTSPRIQQELYIAAGTVNYHCRNIYAKLGVHSKQELIAMFEKPLRT